jgi:hypothetical protein
MLLVENVASAFRPDRVKHYSYHNIAILSASITFTHSTLSSFISNYHSRLCFKEIKQDILVIIAHYSYMAIILSILNRIINLTVAKLYKILTEIFKKSTSLMLSLLAP